MFESYHWCNCGFSTSLAGHFLVSVIQLISASILNLLVFIMSKEHRGRWVPQIPSRLFSGLYHRLIILLRPTASSTNISTFLPYAFQGFHCVTPQLINIVSCHSRPLGPARGIFCMPIKTEASLSHAMGSSAASPDSCAQMQLVRLLTHLAPHSGPPLP